MTDIDAGSKRLPIPELDSQGLLPGGVHDCSIEEIEVSFGWNEHRRNLLVLFRDFMNHELRNQFAEPLYFDGSFVTDKDLPDDIDVVLELGAAQDGAKWRGLCFLRDHQSRLMKDYRVHFWINLPGQNDFCHFFQYVGVKTAQAKGLNPNHLKGILRIN